MAGSSCLSSPSAEPPATPAPCLSSSTPATERRRSCGPILRFIIGVRGVDGICAEHLTVESYTVFICQQSYLLLFWYSITHSLFLSRLKNLPSLQILPTAALPFFYLNICYVDSPDCCTVISQHICFLLLVFFLFLHFLVVGSVR